MRGVPIKVRLSDVSVEVQDLDRHWGEYDDVGVWLNWRLLLAPIRILDYVLVHELAHTEHNDHSEAFWNTVGSLIPDYEECRKWLRINGRMLSI